MKKTERNPIVPNFLAEADHLLSKLPVFIKMDEMNKARTIIATCLQTMYEQGKKYE